MAEECKYVPEFNVTPEHIQYALEDYTTPGGDVTIATNIELSTLFISPNIVPDRIDPNWCAGADDTERFVELSTDDPMSCYNYILYGGCEGDLPEIYFSNLVEWKEKFIDEFEIEGVTLDVVPGKYPIIRLAASFENLEIFYNNSAARFPGDTAAGYLPAYYREDGQEFLQDYGVSTRVGCDYKVVVPDNVKFKIKISAYLADDYITEVKRYFDRKDAVNIPDWVFIMSPALISAGWGTAKFGEFAIEHWHLWDGGTGPFNPFITQFRDLVQLTIETAQSVKALGFLTGLVATYALLRVTVFVADIIFDLVTLATHNAGTIDGKQLWQAATMGVYNNFDIRDSSLDFRTGLYHNGSDGLREFIASNPEEFYTDTYDIKHPLYFTDDYTNKIINPTFSNNAQGWDILGSWTFEDNKAIKQAGAVAGLAQLPSLRENQYYEISITITNYNGEGTIDYQCTSLLPDAIEIQSLPTSNSSGVIISRGHANKIADVWGSISLVASSSFTGYISNPMITALPDRFPYDNIDIIGDYISHNWLNLHAKPRGKPYNKEIPPPATIYFVELIPVAGCTLSTTKPTLFAFVVAPDKAPYPNYKVIPAPNLCTSTIVKLQDAALVDYVYLRDMQNNEGSEDGDWEDWIIPQAFEQYHDIVINRPKDSSSVLDRAVNIFPTGNDLIAFVKTIWGSYYIGHYDVHYMVITNDRYKQLVWNRVFTDRYYGEDPYNIIKKYWDLRDEWHIVGGAAYKTVLTESYFTQYLEGMGPEVNWEALYRLEIEVVNRTAGSAIIYTSPNFYQNLYEANYYFTIWNNNPHTTILDAAQYPTGITLVGGNVYISENGRYILYLRVRSSIDNILKIGGTAAFDGGISFVTLRRMSPGEAFEQEGVASVYNERVVVRRCGDNSTLYILNDTSKGRITITIGNFTENVTVKVYFGSAGPIDVVIPANTTVTFNDDFAPVGWYNGLAVIKIEVPYEPDIYNPETNMYTFASSSFTGAVIPYIKLSGNGVVDIADYYGTLYGAEVDLSNCKLYSKSIIDQYTRIYTNSVYATDENGVYVPMLSRFNYLRKLILDGNPINNDLFHLGSVTEYVDISNTSIFGDLAELSHITDTIKSINNNVGYYSGTPKMHCKNIWWHTLTTPMDVSDLHALVADLYNSDIRGGQLYIAGTNPKIEDKEILYFIFKLVHDFDWIVIYNGYYITAENLANYLITGTDDYVYTLP